MKNGKERDEETGGKKDGEMEEGINAGKTKKEAKEGKYEVTQMTGRKEE